MWPKVGYFPFRSSVSSSTEVEIPEQTVDLMWDIHEEMHLKCIILYNWDILIFGNRLQHV